MKLSKEIKDKIITRYFELGNNRGTIKVISEEIEVKSGTVSYIINKTLNIGF